MAHFRKVYKEKFCPRGKYLKSFIINAREATTKFASKFKIRVTFFSYWVVRYEKSLYFRTTCNLKYNRKLSGFIDKYCIYREYSAERGTQR